MSAALMIPSFIYVELCLLYLPESPRWLVSRGNMNATRQVLQNLLGKEDVTGKGHGLSWFGSQFEPQSINKSSMVDLSVSVSKSFHQLVPDGHHENFSVSSYRQWDKENPKDEEKCDDEKEEEQPGSHVESGPSTPADGLKTPLLYSTDSEHHPQRSRREMFGGAGDQFSPGKLQSRGSIKGSYRGGSMGNTTGSMTGAHLANLGVQEPVHVSALVGEPALCMAGK